MTNKFLVGIFLSTALVACASWYGKGSSSKSTAPSANQGAGSVSGGVASAPMASTPSKSGISAEVASTPVKRSIASGGGTNTKSLY